MNFLISWLWMGLIVFFLTLACREGTTPLAWKLVFFMISLLFWPLLLGFAAYDKLVLKRKPIMFTNQLSLKDDE